VAAFHLVQVDSSERWTLKPQPLVVGRDPQVDVQLDDEKASRRHAVFKLIDGRPCVEDLGSFNGVKVNGRRIEERAVLRSDDLVLIGSTQFRMESEGRADTHAAETLVVSRAALVDRSDGRRFILDRRAKVGRGSSNDVRIDDVSMSREHAELEFPEHAPPLVRDLGSANGTFVNGRRVVWSELRDGDLVAFGDCSFGLQAEGWPEGERPRRQRRRMSGRKRLVTGTLALVVACLALGAVVVRSPRREGPGPDARSDPGAGPKPPAPPGSSGSSARSGSSAPLGSADSVGSSGSSEASEASAASAPTPAPASEPAIARSDPGPRPGLEPSDVDSKRVRARRRTLARRMRKRVRPGGRQRVLVAYVRGDIAAAREEAARFTDERAQRWTRVLDEAETLYDRTRTEVSNDPGRALGYLERLQELEARFMPRGSRSFLVEELRASVVEAFIERGRSAFRSSHYRSAANDWRQARALDADHPGVHAGLRAVQAVVEGWSEEAEVLSQKGDPRACVLWRRVEALAEDDPALRRRAQRRLRTGC
jgi:pSer/pThr/pTyr-binding forkhead associated (FHA) protein